MGSTLTNTKQIWKQASDLDSKTYERKPASSNYQRNNPEATAGTVCKHGDKTGSEKKVETQCQIPHTRVTH